MIAGQWGPECVFIMQMLVTTLILFFFRKILRLWDMHAPAIFFLTAVLLLFTIEYRIIGRPEMFSHLLVMIFLYLLLLYEKKQSPLVWLIVPLQAIWCNMHEAYATGIVMVFIFTAMHFYQAKKDKKALPVTLALLTVLSTAAILLNPRGILLLIRPLNIFGQVQQNKYTTELDSLMTIDYWHKESWVFLLLAFLFFWQIIRVYRKQKEAIDAPYASMGYLSICLAFLFLACTAYRNIVFFVLSVMPMVAVLIKEKAKNIDRFSGAFAIAGVALYLLVVSNKYYSLTSSRDRFGLEVLSINNPAGAASFVAEKKLSAKKCFSDYLTSSYLLWKLQPHFRTYIDLRDLDIFSTAFFEKYFRLINEPAQFFSEDQQQHFDYVILYRRSNDALHYALYNDSIYACTYVDPVAAVYEKTDDIPQGDIFRNCNPLPHSGLAEVINTIFNPAYHYFDYDKMNVDLEAAQFYTTVGKISLAEKRINQFLMVNPTDETAQLLKSRIQSLKSQMRK